MSENKDFYTQTGEEPQGSGLENKPGFVTALGGALAYFFSMLAFVLFIAPYSFWYGATIRLYKACKSKSLYNFVHTSRWPFLSYMKKVFFEFFIDGFMFISYFLGIIFAFYGLFDEGFDAFILILVGTYYSPLFISWIRDLCVLALLPFQKFLSWVSKPAQQIDVDFHNH